MVGNGSGNTVSSSFSSVLNGGRNTITSTGGISIINSGILNTTSSNYTLIGVGACNTIQSSNGIIVGGFINKIFSGGSYNLISNGVNNRICTNNSYSTIINGTNNQTINGVSHSGIMGVNNTMNHSCSYILGSGITSQSNCTTHVNCINIRNICTSAVVPPLPAGTVYRDASGFLKIV
jgi:hypothetical protein